ncbi:dephospho-CoA kinase, partial [Candidatus Pelagibacter sp.]|nr:dephospho-CoA kinase [Candidatus Pelagibacter sp.]
MIKIGILGDIGSGKSYVAQNFGYPVFNADHEVAKLYQKDKNVFKNLKKKLPKYIHSFPIKKKEISNAILSNRNNLNEIVKIVHAEIRKKINIFLKKNKNKKIVILDIPLLLENKINNRKDILVY